MTIANALAAVNRHVAEHGVFTTLGSYAPFRRPKNPNEYITGPAADGSKADYLIIGQRRVYFTDGIYMSDLAVLGEDGTITIVDAMDDAWWNDDDDNKENECPALATTTSSSIPT